MEEIKLYTLEEVSKILKLGTRTVTNYIKSGKLEAIKVSNYWRIKHQSLEKFLNTGTK